MYLIRLTANKPSFHTIEFKEGLNFIIGGVQDKKDKQNKTYNGVGKSLIIKIIHFSCLIVNANNYLSLKKKNIVRIYVIHIC